MVHTFLPENEENNLNSTTSDQVESFEKNSDLAGTLSPNERTELRREAVHILADDKKIWHGCDHTGGFRGARYNRRLFAEAGANEEVIEAAIKASLKGFWGERLSSAVPLDKAQTVFTSKYIEHGRLQNLEMLDIWGGKERPENGNNFLTEEEQKETVKEAISLLTSSGEGGKSKDNMPQTEEGWDAYIDRYGKNTVEPDALLANLKTNKYVGPVEVKMYTEEEVRALVEGIKINADKTESISSISPTEAVVEMPGLIKQMTLGANLEAEYHYIENNIKGRSGYISENPLDMFAVLRFPEDVPDDLLVELGQLMEQAHYAVVIQKIPFTNQEINVLAKTKTAKYLTLIQKNTLPMEKNNSKVNNGASGSVKYKGGFFTPRDIRIYERLSDPRVEW